MERERVYIDNEIHEYVPDRNGGHFKVTHEKIDVTETADRHCDLCKVCKFPTYPECMSFCPNMKPKKKR